MYVNDYGAYPKGTWSALDDPVFWRDQLVFYIHQNWTNDLYRCPGNSLKLGDQLDYDINDYGAGGGGIGGTEPKTSDSISTWSSDRPVRASEILAPTQLLAFGDSVLTGQSMRRLSYYSGALTVLFGGTRFAPGAFYGSSTLDNLPDRISAQRRRHAGRFNVVYCDAHAESLATNHLFGLTDDVMRHWNRDNELHHEAWVNFTR